MQYQKIIIYHNSRYFNYGNPQKLIFFFNNFQILKISQEIVKLLQ
jgi:hypothetical protein